MPRARRGIQYAAPLEFDHDRPGVLDRPPRAQWRTRRAMTALELRPLRLLRKQTMTEIRVPTLGESVTEATIGRWFKKAGDAVAVDEPLVELETDKVTIEVPAPSAGVLGEIAAKDGETVAVGALLGQINEGAASAAKPAAAHLPRLPPLRPPPRLLRPRRLRHPMRRWRRRFANSPPRAASMPRPCRAPARTAASPRATCWPRSRRRRPRRPRSISRPPPCRCARPRRPTMPRARSA